jgi:hypothetical protein
VTFRQLLGRKRRAEVCVVRLDERQRLGPHDRRVRPVARLAAPLRLTTQKCSLLQCVLSQLADFVAKVVDGFRAE